MFTVKNLIARFIGLIVITVLYLAIYGAPEMVVGWTVANAF